jgi:hypothetical protein
MPESQLRQRVRAALQRAFPDALVIGWPANFWTGSGWPDLLVLDWPLLLGLEVKQGRRSKPTPVQGARHSLLRRHHVPVFVIHTPPEAVWTITTLKEKLPMAFDPALLAELEAALNEAPAEPAPEPEPIPTTEIDPDTLAPDASDNGTVVLDADAPAPDIEDLTATIIDGEEIPEASWLDKGPFAGLSGDDARMLATTDALAELQKSVDALTAAVRELLAELQSEPTEAPRRGRRRAT